MYVLEFNDDDGDSMRHHFVKKSDADKARRLLADKYEVESSVYVYTDPAVFKSFSAWKRSHRF